MTNTNETKMNTIKDEACDWLAYLYSDDATEEGENEFRAWMRADAAHAAAFKEIHTLYESLDQIEGIEERLPPAMAANNDNDTALAGASSQLGAAPSGMAGAGTAPVRWIVGAAMMAAAVFAFFLVSTPEPVQTAPAQNYYASSVGELKTVELTDGSTVTLGADTVLRTSFSGTRRGAILEQGRAYFDVARDENRAFEILVGKTAVTVLGTEFDIRKGPSDVRVSVTEGLVRVSGAGAVSAGIELRAGDQIIAGLDGTFSDTLDFNQEETLDWRQGRLSYSDARLADIVADANRYRRAGITIESEQIADMRITTSFRVDQIDGFLDGLEAIGPIAVERRPSGIVVLTDPEMK